MDITKQKLAEDALFSAIVSQSADAIVSMTLEGAITSWNAGAERLFGFGAAEMVGQPIRRIIPAERFQEEGGILARIVAGEFIEPYDTVRLRKDGRAVDVSLIVSPVRDADGRIIGAVEIPRDISERKKAEGKLRDISMEYSRTLDTAVTGLTRCSRDLRYLSANSAYAKWIALPREQIVGRTIVEVMGQAAFDVIRPYVERVLQGERVEYEAELPIEGSSKPIQVVYQPDRDAAGNIVGWVASVTDISRLKAMQRIAESEQQFHTLANAIPQLAWMANADGGSTWFNRRWYEYTGATPEQMEGWGWQSIHDPETLPAVLERWKESVTTGEPFEMVFPLRGADGVFRQFLTRVQPLKNAEGRVLRWFGTNTNVDELKRAERELERQAQLLELSHEAVFTWKLHGAIESWNKGAAELYGYSVDEAVGRVSHDLLATLHPDGMAAVLKQLETAGKWRGELIHLTKGGRAVIVDSSLQLLRDEDNLVLESNRDITGSKQAEHALRESEEKYRAIVASAPHAIVVIDEAAQIQTVNPATERIFGYEPGELVGKNVSILMPEPDRSLHDGYVSNYLRTGIAKIIGIGRQVQYQKKNGTICPAELTITEWRAGGKRYFTGIVQDITERKRYEEKISLLLREVNHRSKNMLTLVYAVARQTIATTADDFLERFGERIYSLAASQDLLVSSDWAGVDLGKLVCSQLAHFKDLIGQRIELSGPSILVNASAAQAIGMALHELATNAGKYGALSTGAGRVVIRWAIGPCESGEKTFVISWREEGGPPVKPPSRSGFGSTVISRMAGESLDAKVELTFPVEGLSWRLECLAKEVTGEKRFEMPKQQPSKH